MAFNFPSSPNSGDTFVGGGVTYTYDGTSWSSSAGIVTTDIISSGVGEAMQYLSSITGTQTVDLDNGHIINCSSVTGNLTINLTNTGLPNSHGTAVVVNVIQGSTAYSVTIGTVDSATPTVLYEGSAGGAGNPNKTDTYVFNIQKDGSGNYKVLVHHLTYG